MVDQLSRLSLDPRASATLHDQIARLIRGAIARGELTRSSPLPTARRLASHLHVNVNTVLRAYRQLADEGLVDIRRGRGTVVTHEPDLADLYRLADELLAEAARLGVSRGRLLAILAERS